MAGRGLVGLLLLVASCSGDAGRVKAKQAEASATPEVSAQAFSFDNVPSMIRSKAQLTLPPIFPAISKLPSSVRSVERYSKTTGAPSAHPIIRSADMAFEFCDTEPINALARWKKNFYAAEGLAELLHDGRLAPKLECGGKAAVASGFQWYIIRFHEASRVGAVSLLPRDARIAPAFYQAPAKKPAGLEQLSCDELDGDGCAAHAHAVAVIPRLDMLAAGEIAALKLLALEPVEKWLAADPARLPSLTAEETASADVSVMVGGDLGALNEAFSEKDPAGRATESVVREALQRAEAVVVTAVPAFQEGTGVFVISTRGGTVDVANALVDLKRVAAHEVAPVESEIEDQYSEAVADSRRRGLAQGTVEITGNEVRFRFKYVLNAREAELRRQSEAARATRLVPLASVLGARVASQAPSTEDLDGVSPALAKAFLERAERKRGAPTTMTPDLLPYLKLPAFLFQGKTLDNNQTVDYQPAIPPKVDDLIDTLRNDGWKVKLAQTWGDGPILRATKKQRRLKVNVQKKNDTELSTRFEEN